MKNRDVFVGETFVSITCDRKFLDQLEIRVNFGYISKSTLNENHASILSLKFYTEKSILPCQ